MARSRWMDAVMLRAGAAMLVVLIASSVHAKVLILEAEIMESSADIALPGLSQNRMGYAILHHKRQQDRPALSAWLRSHAGASVVFQTQDGIEHQAVLQRLTHCFGRGLLLYTAPVRLEAKAVILLRLEVTD
jgi:hypothetical protein